MTMSVICRVLCDGMATTLLAVLPGAATTSIRPSLGPVTGAGWVVAVVVGSALATTFGTVVVVVVVVVVLVVVVVAGGFLAASFATAAAFAAAAAELAATEDCVAESWVASDLVRAAWAASAALLAPTAVECTAGLRSRNHTSTATASRATNPYPHFGRTAFWERAPSSTTGFSFSGVT